MASATKRKQINVSMDNKLDALKKLDKGENINKIALDLGVGRSTIIGWKKQRPQIEAWCSKRLCTETLQERKNMKGGEFEKVSEALYIWFRQHRENGVPMSGPILQEKALKFHNELREEGQAEFTASVGWLDRWKKRYGIRGLNICGEKLSAKEDSVTEFKVKFQELISKEGISGDQLYNCDETGLNFRMLPSKTLASKIEKSAPGYKRSKERVTILACSNTTGEHKLKLLLIGKAKNPRAFKHVKRYTDKGNTNIDLPVLYRNQKSAWMDGAIFKDWFFQTFVPSVERFLKSKNLPRKALLILDNATSHPDVHELQDGEIKTLFLPPNVTSLCQPMDQGVLESLKKRYRKKLLSSLILAIDEGHSMMEKLKKIDMLDVVGWVSEAWNEVAPITIVRSWRKLLDHEGDEFKEIKEEESSNLVALLKKIPGCEGASDGDVEDWMQLDATSEPLGDDEIVAAVVKQSNEEEMSEDEDVEAGPTVQKMSHSEGLKAIESALCYFEQQNTSAVDILFLRRLRDEAARRRTQCEKQPTINKFFSKYCKD